MRAPTKLHVCELCPSVLLKPGAAHCAAATAFVDIKILTMKRRWSAHAQRKFHDLNCSQTSSMSRVEEKANKPFFIPLQRQNVALHVSVTSFLQQSDFPLYSACMSDCTVEVLVASGAPSCCAKSCKKLYNLLYPFTTTIFSMFCALRISAFILPTA